VPYAKTKFRLYHSTSESSITPWISGRDRSVTPTASTAGAAVVCPSQTPILVSRNSLRRQV